MKDLTASQIIELEGLIQEFVRDRVLDGLACIVIVAGRGQDRLAFPETCAELAPDMLERAWLTARKRSLRAAN